MNLLFSCVGRRSYMVEYFRAHLEPGDRIIGTSNSKWTAGFRTCDLGVVLPDIVSPDYIPTLIELCQMEHMDALLSFFDPDIDVLSKHLDEFRAVGVVPILPSAEVSDICFDKYRTYLFCQEHADLDAPGTFSNLEQALAALDAGRISFPLMIKPRCGFASRHLFQARTVQELEVFYHYAPDMLVQEMLTGQEYHLDVCNDLCGQVLAVVPKRKVRMRAGETDQAVSSDDPRLIEMGMRLGEKLGQLGHVGPLDVDLFVRDGRTILLELNPRFGGGYPMSHLAGADFPRLVLSLIRGESPEPEAGQFRPGVIMMKGYSIYGGEPQDFFGSVLDMRGATESQKIGAQAEVQIVP